MPWCDNVEPLEGDAVELVGDGGVVLEEEREGGEVELSSKAEACSGGGGGVGGEGGGMKAKRDAGLEGLVLL